MFMHLLFILTAVVAGYYASDAYMKRWSWKHVHARLWGLLIFMAVMVIVQDFLYTVF